MIIVVSMCVLVCVSASLLCFVVVDVCFVWCVWCVNCCGCVGCVLSGVCVLLVVKCVVDAFDVFVALVEFEVLVVFEVSGVLYVW